jgi:hypothetical protein
MVATLPLVSAKAKLNQDMPAKSLCSVGAFSLKRSGKYKHNQCAHAFFRASQAGKILDRIGTN